MGRNSLVVVHGQAHERLRSFVSNSINRPDALQLIAACVQPRLVSALHSWAQLGKFKAYKEIKKLTLQNIGKLFASLEPGPILDSLDKLYDGMLKGIRAYPLNFPGTASHHAIQCRKKLEAIFRVELEKKKKEEEQSNRVGTTNDLMDGLMQMIDEEGNQLSDQEVLDNIISLIIGGYESTTLASMWAIYYLAKYPDVLGKLREENLAMWKKKKGDFITIEDVSELKYTNKVVEETIRSANVSGFIFRLVTKEVEYKGYRIPKNWKVIIWLRYLHTNTENFEDPLCFNPERWNVPARPGTYLVFGGGPRICAGNMLARMQLAILLHHLSVGYKWELLNPDAKMIYLPNPAPADGAEIAFSKI
ncbi:hypothetical protein GH714_040839 [Hevea brasiliensis]|uniref:Ent-kaurenoic acid oxidase n=1 Tax=Hevea brasiliensis TaxID=3981 RepID=A0A6A6MS58_HEVBR|nr:hypothetical protein GH714_040839 [Hevea brasiliensis]